MIVSLDAYDLVRRLLNAFHVAKTRWLTREFPCAYRCSVNNPEVRECAST